ncbi:MAG: decaprenyl-phosphate phosphoribosyltransferase [Calothrix sp. MO_167.B12]|nr:decaprenyl-phosphate phosphoribosyltransferase [Calothrix sp. MO_167.B12]
MDSRQTSFRKKLSNGSSRNFAYLTALRPRQWTKNLVVFAAPLFAFSINLQSLLGGWLAFMLFCATSSSFYLFNDIVDVESDRQHPIKCKRPIAAGLISIPIALGMAVILLVGAITIAWLQSPALGGTILAYATLQVAYNLRLKRVAILDIGVIAGGFVLRANGGAAATNIALSSWFVICTAMLALFLAIEKRKAELRLTQIKGIKPRAVLQRYSLPLLHRMENIVTTGTVVTYTLWSSGPVVRGASTSWMLMTLPFVLYGIFRYQLLSDSQEIARHSHNNIEHGGRSERPEEVLLKDIPILMTVCGWIFTCSVILYLKQQGLIE